MARLFLYFLMAGTAAGGTYIYFIVNDSGKLLEKKSVKEAFSDWYGTEQSGEDIVLSLPILEDSTLDHGARNYKYPLPPAMPPTAWDLIRERFPAECHEHARKVLEIHPFDRPNVYTNGKGDILGGKKYLSEVLNAFTDVRQCNLNLNEQDVHLKMLNKECSAVRANLDSPFQDAENVYMSALETCFRGVSAYRHNLLQKLVEGIPLAKISDTVLLEQLYERGSLSLEYSYPISSAFMAVLPWNIEGFDRRILDRLLEINPRNEEAIVEITHRSLDILRSDITNPDVIAKVHYDLEKYLPKLAEITSEPLGVWRIKLTYADLLKDPKQIKQAASYLENNSDSSHETHELNYYYAYASFLEGNSADALKYLKKWDQQPGGYTVIKVAVERSIAALSLGKDFVTVHEVQKDPDALNGFLAPALGEPGYVHVVPLPVAEPFLPN